MYGKDSLGFWAIYIIAGTITLAISFYLWVQFTKLMLYCIKLGW